MLIKSSLLLSTRFLNKEKRIKINEEIFSPSISMKYLMRFHFLVFKLNLEFKGLIPMMFSIMQERIGECHKSFQ